MDVSLVIVNWNTRDLLRRCLESVAGLPEAANGRLTVEAVVVDNASHDGSAAMVREAFPWAKLIASDDNMGWAKGNNVGIREAQGRYVMLLNPDTEIRPGALAEMAAFMDAHPKAGACAPKLLYPTGEVQRSLRRFPEPMSLFYDLIGLSKLFPRSATFAAYRMGDFGYDRVEEVDQPMGAALFIRREALEDVGLIDEAFPLFFNDVDWALRAVQKGWKIHFIPQAVVVHHEGSSTRQVKPRMIAESHRSLERFYEKHYKGRIPGWVFHGIVRLSRAVERMRIARAQRARRGDAPLADLRPPAGERGTGEKEAGETRAA